MMILVLAQIVKKYLPGYKIEEIARGEKIKAREFSYSAQVYLLMLGQLAHVFSLNELVDLALIFSGELRRIRGIEAVKLSTFSHANRTRSPSSARRRSTTRSGRRSFSMHWGRATWVSSTVPTTTSPCC